jgi:hypothetical protein
MPAVKPSGCVYRKFDAGGEGWGAPFKDAVAQPA